MGASHVAATGYHRRLGLRRCRNPGTKGKDIMAVTRSAAKTAAARSAAKPVRDGVTLQMFLWEGTDKRGKKMKGEQQAKSSNMLRAELRRPGIKPPLGKPPPTPPFGRSTKAVT